LKHKKSIDLSNNRQCCPLKKKEKKKKQQKREIKRMNSRIEFLSHGNREERDSKINIDMYTHCSDVVVKIMGVFS